MYDLKKPGEENPYDTTEKVTSVSSESVRTTQEAVLDQGDGRGDESVPATGGSDGDQSQRTVRAQCSDEPGCSGSGNRDRVRIRISPITHGKTLGLLIDYMERSKQQTRAEIAIIKGLVNTLESQLEAQDELLTGLKDALKGWQSSIEEIKRDIYPQGNE